MCCYLERVRRRSFLPWFWHEGISGGRHQCAADGDPDDFRDDAELLGGVTVDVVLCGRLFSIAQP